MLLENKNAVVHGAGGTIGGARLRPGGGHWLAHTANHEGLIAVDHMAGRDPIPLDPNFVPHVTFCRPEIASFDLSEHRARERGQEVKVGHFPFRAVGKALIEGEREGFVKIVSDVRSGLILGMQAVGRHFTELISEGVFARLVEGTAQEMAMAVHAHPTLTEDFGEAAMVVDEPAINY